MQLFCHDLFNMEKKIIVITLLKCMAQKLEGNISNKQQLQKTADVH